ncbi:MAG: DNA/RNA nuclease SfsA [Epsilonproteobacteria bacterium]|jgi:sugar fermentation stimulation protein A|nr:DNA/RNA nuclease SfsA [Campylobacterota bacterium]NPA89254.1 DNA/RNA nuclease SfsA [Campylobacterota bacterium]
MKPITFSNRLFEPIPLPIEVVAEGKFLERPNRFIGVVQVEGKEHRVHIADTGRLRELLIKGAKVYLGANPNGKLDYKLLGVEYQNRPVFLNPSFHSPIGEELIKRGILGYIPSKIQREKRVGKSRIDFLVDTSHWVEIKGCNLLLGEWCLFPDAPTTRGSRHIGELTQRVEMGERATLLFLLFQPCTRFGIYKKRDPELHSTLNLAQKKGVEILGVQLEFLPYSSTGKVEIIPSKILPFGEWEG